MDTPRGSRNFVVDTFHNGYVKQLLCNVLLIKNYNKLKKCLWYRAMTPTDFVIYVLKKGDIEAHDGDIRNALVEAGNWLNTFRDKLYVEAFKKCIQILVEYAELLLRHTASLFNSIFEPLEVIRALVKTTTDSGKVLISTLEAFVDVDKIMFNSCLTLVINKCTYARAVTRVKNMITWYERVKGGNEQKVVCTDVDFVDIFTLLKFQRVYEESMMLRFPIDDITSTGSLWNLILGGRYDSPFYKHSLLVEGDVEENSWQQRCMCIKAVDSNDDIYTLVLHNGRFKPSPSFRYEGMLEIMSLSDDSDRLFVAKQFRHLLLRDKNETSKVFVSDQFNGHYNTNDKVFKTEEVVTKLNQLKDALLNVEIKPEKYDISSISSEKKEESSLYNLKKLKKTTADDYEANQLMTQSYCVDILLWLATRVNMSLHSSR